MGVLLKILHFTGITVGIYLVKQNVHLTHTDRNVMRLHASMKFLLINASIIISIEGLEEIFHRPRAVSTRPKIYAL